MNKLHLDNQKHILSFLSLEDKFKHYGKLEPNLIGQYEEPNVLLKYAIKYDNDKMLKYALEQGADDYLKGYKYALRERRGKLIKFFKEKIDMEIATGSLDQDDVRKVVLIESARAGKLKEVERYRKIYDDQGIISYDYLDAGLVAAAKGGHLKLVKFFMQEGVREYLSAFLYAIKFKHDKLIKYFIEDQHIFETIDSFSGDDESYNDIMYFAARAGNTKMIDIVERYVVNVFDEEDLLPFVQINAMGLSGAARAGNNELINYFGQKIYKLDPNTETYIRKIITLEAATSEHIRLIKNNMGDEVYIKALENAADKGQLKTVKFIVNEKLSGKKHNFENAIDSAEEKKYHKTVQYLRNI